MRNKALAELIFGSRKNANVWPRMDVRDIALVDEKALGQLSGESGLKAVFETLGNDARLMQPGYIPGMGGMVGTGWGPDDTQVVAYAPQQGQATTWEESKQYPFRNLKELITPNKEQMQILYNNGGVSLEQARVMTGMMDLPPTAQRPFEMDFPEKNYQVDPETGDMKTDIDGRDINPDAIVVGRRKENEPDIALSDEEIDKVHKRLTGQNIDYADLDNGRIIGYYSSSRDGKKIDPITINRHYYDNDRYKELAIGTKRHEIAHLIEDIAGTLNNSLETVPEDILKGLYAIYNEQKNPYLGFERLRYPQSSAEDAGVWNGFTPAALGYNVVDDPAKDLRDHTRRELYAEAIRSYLTDPNALKERYPEVAKYLRDQINLNPKLNEYIHLSSNEDMNTSPYFPLVQQSRNA